MQEIKRGTRRPVAAKKAVVKYDPKNEATEEDVKVAAKKVARKTTKVERFTEQDVEEELKPVAQPKKLPTTIAVRQSEQLKVVVPGHVWRQGPFKWDPMAFAVESERLHERIVDPAEQEKSLQLFLDNPQRRMVYGVSGNPHDGKAKLFAAYLVAQHIAALGLRSHVVWHTVYDGFENKLLKEYDEIDGKSPPTMLVLTNITPNASSVRLGKVRDLLERFSEIPRVVVMAGEDPLSFFTTRLYYKINALAYFSESLIRKKVEVI